MGLQPPLTRHAQLAQFRRHHRARITPQSVGLTGNASRPTPGLRRKEVSQPAAVAISRAIDPRGLVRR